MIVSSARLLMTCDAVGGVWRYALDLAGALGVEVVLVGLGPEPSAAQRREAEACSNLRLVWLDLPCDWMAAGPTDLAALPVRLRALAGAYAVDLVHLNAPAQAAGLTLDRPVVAVSHSCLPTWWAAVRSTALPPDLSWHDEANHAGFAAADVAISPSRSHAAALRARYGALPRLRVVPNATAAAGPAASKFAHVLAAGRWWDEGKGGATLDAAAAASDWPVLMAGPLGGPNGAHATLVHATALGPLSAAETAGRISRAAIVASPSIYEPFGLVALEAASAGAALVLSDIDTYVEFWSGAARFVPPGDARAFAASLNALAADPELRVELGAAAAARAAALTLAAQADAMRAAYLAAAQPAKAA